MYVPPHRPFNITPRISKVPAPDRCFYFNPLKSHFGKKVPKFEQKMFDSEEMDAAFHQHPEFFASYFPTPKMAFLFMGDLNSLDPDVQNIFKDIQAEIRAPFLTALQEINS